MPHDKHITLSYSGKLYLLLEDVESAHWHSTWLDLETGRVKEIDRCQRELLNEEGWKRFEDVV